MISDTPRASRVMKIPRASAFHGRQYLNVSRLANWYSSLDFSKSNENMDLKSEGKKDMSRFTMIYREMCPFAKSVLFEILSNLSILLTAPQFFFLCTALIDNEKIY